MSLKWYRRPRLVVLNQKSSVLEAARAIENNNIGQLPEELRTVFSNNLS